MGDDELYRQELLCEFLDESTAFLTYEQIAACTDPELTLHALPEDLADDPRELFAGVDVGLPSQRHVSERGQREGLEDLLSLLVGLVPHPGHL